MEENSLVFENLMKVLDDYGQEAKRLYQTKLQEDKKIASGKLINNIQIQIAYVGLNFDVIMLLEDYWKYVEKGRGKGKRWPPEAAILNWIRIKPVIPYADKNGKLPTEKQLCYLIRRKIGRDGIEPTDALKTSLEALNNYYMPILQQALEKDWEVYSIKIWQDINKLVKL